jgi:hypothetical protein
MKPVKTFFYTFFILMMVTAEPTNSMAGSYTDQLDSFLQSIWRIFTNQRHSRPEKHEKQPGAWRKSELPYDIIITEAALHYRLDPFLLHAMIRHESDYRHDAVSHKGAKGLMQLMPATAKEMGVDNYFDPRQNIIGGARYYRMLLDQFGDHRLALLAYNSGPTTVKRGIRYKESERYANKVIATWHMLYNHNYINP